MGERKALNKYYPPDYDWKKIPRLPKSRNKQKKIRFMLANRIRCNTCGNYMSQGTKFISREEEADMYLTVKIHRFYIKCTNCSAEVLIKTDPENTRYRVESGATFPYNREEEEENNYEEITQTALESLEKRTMVSKREIEVMATLDEIKSMKSRRALVTVDSMLQALMSRRKKQEEEINEEEELLIKSIKFGKRTRIDEEYDEKKKKPKRLNCGRPLIKFSSIRIISKKKTTKLPMGLESLCHNYGTSIDDEM